MTITRPPTFAEWRDHLAELEHRFFAGAWNPNLGGIRNASRQAGGWDDWMILAYEDDRGHGLLHAYPGSTDPSRTWLQTEKRNAAGTAILIPQQARGCWAVGPKYKGISAHKYLCFKQVGAIRYVRDDNGDGILDIEQLIAEGKVRDDIRGFDGHRASSVRAVPTVGLYGAGCQVWRLLQDFEHARSFTYWAAQYHGHRVSYTLVDDWRR